MLVTTYQHDYIPPYTKRYDFLKNAGQLQQKPEEVCQCVEEPRVEMPKVAPDQCATAEWTGIAPMGRLIEARIIPTKLSPDQIKGLANDQDSDCFKEQPNRFLKILRTSYPDLYERLKQMPKDELNRRLERQRMFTTYQIDYCYMNEYPEGIYDSLKQEDENKKINASKLLTREGPCSEFRSNVMQELDKQGAEGYDMRKDPCEKAYKPFKITFADSSRFINSGNNSHWRSNVFAKRANFSEYMDTINKCGCVIMKNNLHNHSKCINGKHCRHKILYACTNLE